MNHTPVWVYAAGIPGMDEYGNAVAEMECQAYGYMTKEDAATYDLNGVVDIEVHGPEAIHWPFCEGSSSNPVPVYVSSEVGSVPAAIEVTFNETIKITDETGITVTVDAAGGTILGVVVENNILHIALDAIVTTGQAVTFAYDGAGNLAGFGGASVEAIAEKVVTNNVT